MNHSVEEFFITKKHLEDDKFMKNIERRCVNLMKSSYEYKNFLKYVGGINIIGFPIPFSTNVKIIIERSIAEDTVVSTLSIANKLMVAIMKYEIPFLIIKTSFENDIMLASYLLNHDITIGIPDTVRNIIQNNLFGNPELIIKYLEENKDFINLDELEKSYDFHLWKMYLQSTNYKMKE